MIRVGGLALVRQEAIGLCRDNASIMVSARDSGWLGTYLDSVLEAVELETRWSKSVEAAVRLAPHVATTEGWFVDMLTRTAGHPDYAHGICEKLTSQHELAIWQPAWPTRDTQESVGVQSHIRGIDGGDGSGGGGGGRSAGVRLR